MTITANEQYMLELMNRARLDPRAEAARYGIDLNEGLAPGTLNGAARQVLAPNALLDQSAEAHSQWMLDTDTFSHTGVNGSDPGDRMRSAGYVFSGTWTWGENVSWTGSTGTINLATSIEAQHRSLFLSSGHRVNTLNDDFREVGVAQVAGPFTTGGQTYNASMVTQNFALSGAPHYLTGVAYADSDDDGFYSIGEGRSGATFAVGNGSGTAAAAGGYALATLATGIAQITVTAAGNTSVVKADFSVGNVKLDLVNGTEFLSSASLTLVSGVADARLLGIGTLSLTGNAAANALTGNAGANVLNGKGGMDTLSGAAGNDRLLGVAGADRLDGGLGNDTLTGGKGADRFVFHDDFGADKVVDFKSGQGDRLHLDDALWGGGMTAAQVVETFADVVNGSTAFNFGGGDVLTLAGLTDMAGLSGQIDII